MKILDRIGYKLGNYGKCESVKVTFYGNSVNNSPLLTETKTYELEKPFIFYDDWADRREEIKKLQDKKTLREKLNKEALELYKNIRKEEIYKRRYGVFDSKAVIEVEWKIELISSPITFEEYLKRNSDK